jgi:hypothetical protein
MRLASNGAGFQGFADGLLCLPVKPVLDQREQSNIAWVMAQGHGFSRKQMWTLG